MSDVTTVTSAEQARALLAAAKPPERILWAPAGLELCLVPAGDFVMGATEEEVARRQADFGGGLEVYRSATPRRVVHLPAFYMGRTPVTNAQYARFTDATGHAIPYVDAAWAVPYNWDRATRAPHPDRADHPVTLISWEDAAAYCAWAGLALPSEAAWEKAARGTDGRRYPWGDTWDGDRCNNAERLAGELPDYAAWQAWWQAFSDRDPTERNRDTLTPVGAYSPAGDSPYGCADMAGNVWEWCADAFKAYPGSTHHRARYDTGERVLRGGAWFSTRMPVQTFWRSGDQPTRHDDSRGFRCCLPA